MVASAHRCMPEISCIIHYSLPSSKNDFHQRLALFYPCFRRWGPLSLLGFESVTYCIVGKFRGIIFSWIAIFKHFVVMLMVDHSTVE